MPDEVDSLILEASVIDNFSRQLDELSRELTKIEAKGDIDIDANADIGQAMVELEMLEKQMDSIDRKDVDIDIGLDRDQLDMIAAEAQIDRIGRRGALAMTRDADLPTPGLMGPGGTDIDVDRRSRMAVLDSLTDAGNVLGQTVGEAMDMPDLFEGRRGSRDRPTFTEVRRKFGNLRISMGMFMNLMASFIPLFAVFVGALPAAIAGLGALAVGAIAAAGALAGVVGLGLGAMMFEDGELNVGELQEHIRSALDTGLESFAPLMEALQPVAESLFRNMNFLIRDLGNRMRVLLSLTDEAGAVFQWMADVIGPALQEMIVFGEAMAPVMSLVVGGAGSIDWFGIMADVMSDTLPLLVTFVGHIMNMLPAIYDMSLGFFQVANAITAFFSILWSVIDIIPMGAQFIGSLVSVILAAVSASALWSLATGRTVRMLALVSITILQRVVGAVAAYTTSMFGAAAGTWAAYAAVAALVGLLTFGLAPIISGAVGALTGLNNNLGDTTDQLDQFQKQQNTIGGGFSGPSSGGQSGPGYGNVNNNITIEAPDRETGNAAAHTAAFANRTATTDQSDVENRQHGGG